MISLETYSLDWIKSIKTKLGKKIDAKMLEKVIYALSLLEQLKLNELDLIFKGGTCLLLTSKKPLRFSIDIDIITQENEEKIEKVLHKIIETGIFTKWEPDNDRKTVSNAPIKHYKFYYGSKVDDSFGEEPILLDVMICPSPYPVITDQAVEHDWIDQSGDPITIKIPVYECILGDKLTAFAPKTTGILYSKERPVEIIKQLHDIGFLFDLSKDINLVKQSYLRVVKEELGYRSLNISYIEVLHDTFDACVAIASRDENNVDYLHLQKGINNITNFIINRFKIEEAITAAGKVAYLCGLLMQEEIKEPERFKSPDQIKETAITHKDYQWLNKQKKLNPEAFFYWEKAIALKS
ncbi:MAG: hypothetical protein JWP12_1401 [Bacteroidetes bacterium]|nr:hypothetical protein [Bacteroidota bacterium]